MFALIASQFFTSIESTQVVRQATLHVVVNAESVELCSANRVNNYISDFEYAWKRRAAISNLVVDCGQSASATLIETLKTHANPKIRTSAVEALAYIGGEDSIEALIVALRRDSSPIVRRTSADALGYLRNSDAVDHLISTLLQLREDLSVRKAAAESLGSIGDITAIAPLIATLHNVNEHLNLRNEAAKAMGKIGDVSIDSLTLSLESTDLWTRYLAAVTLTEIQTRRSHKVLTAYQAEVTHIFEEAYDAQIVEFDRIPSRMTVPGSRAQFTRRPILCKLEWVKQNWSRCK